MTDWLLSFWGQISGLATLSVLVFVVFKRKWWGFLTLNVVVIYWLYWGVAEGLRSRSESEQFVDDDNLGLMFWSFGSLLYVNFIYGVLAAVRDFWQTFVLKETEGTDNGVEG